MNIRRSVIVNLIGGLDNNGNCEVGMFEVRGVPLRRSFLRVRATMTLQETIRQVKAEICENRKQIAHTRLESIAGG